MTLPDGSPFPNLFDFKKEELNPLGNEDFNTTLLIPDWYRQQMAEKERLKMEEAKSDG